jgi:hypothetical protein
VALGPRRGKFFLSQQGWAGGWGVGSKIAGLYASEGKGTGLVASSGLHSRSWTAQHLSSPSPKKIST